jgi:DNA repair photolyase
MNAIYQPKGKAAEYAEWACNFYVGCSNNCSYCYLKQGRGAKILGGDTPTLKKCFKNEEHALEVFKKEVKANLGELQEKGLFFSFTTDWALSECIELHKKAIDFCVDNQISVKLLTKRADFIDKIMED